MAHSTDLASNFDFDTISEFAGYISSRDKTNITSNVMVAGSQNIYKKISGTLAVRPGQKRLYAANATYSPVSSEFVWNTSWGVTYPIWVTNNTLQVNYKGIWHSLLTGLDATRYVFDSWYSPTEAKDILLFVHGNADIQYWSGGIATVDSATAAVAGNLGDVAVDVAGSGYNAGDIITVVGGTNGKLKVTSVSSGGVVTFDIINAGSGYSTGTNVSTTGGSGSGFTVNISTVFTGGTITKEDPSISWQQAGFSSGSTGDRKIMIAGTEYAYVGGEDGATLNGVSPTPGTIPHGTIAIQSVITATDTPGPNVHNDFLKVINNQVYIGSYTSRIVYISSNVAFLNYTVPTPRQAGDPELITLDGTGKGIGVRQGNAYIGFGSSSWAIISFSNITVGSTLTQQTKVDVKPVANLQAPYAHEFIDNVGDSLIYLAQDSQVRMFGETNNLFTPAYPSLSQDIHTELELQNFTGGGLRCIGEFVYLTVPTTGQVYLYQVRTYIDNRGNTVAERLWHSPFVWNLTRVDVIDGVVVGFSNANPQVYQLWNTGQWYDDSPSDEQLPYECILALSYRDGGRPQGLISFDKIFSEGYIAPGTPLNLRVNYNYQGSLAVLLATINSISQPAATFIGTSAPSLGDSSLGDHPEGDGVEFFTDPQDSLPEFKVINSMSIQNCFEYQPIYYSDAVNAQWEVKRTGSNATIEADQQATFIINKLRR